MALALGQLQGGAGAQLLALQGLKTYMSRIPAHRGGDHPEPLPAARVHLQELDVKDLKLLRREEGRGPHGRAQLRGDHDAPGAETGT